MTEIYYYKVPPITDEDLYGNPTVVEYFDDVTVIKEGEEPPVDSEGENA